MSETSPRLSLPFIQAAQAQKHVTHNEAVERLDLLVQLTVQGFDATTPPAAPEDGQVWALGDGPGGDWSGQGGRLAAWVNGGWLFVTPAAGWRAAQGSGLRIFDGADWVVPDLPVLDILPGVGINTVHDATNRLAVASQASLFSHEGAGHQVKINKAAATDTASLLFQTGFSGRAEMGTAGTDDFAVKVSADGSAWRDGLVVNRTSGAVSLPNGLSVGGALALPAGGVTRAALAAGTALSLVGRSANSAGPVADIGAGVDHQVLRRSGTAIGFGAVALDQSAAVTGLLALANGGTGAATAAEARTNLGLPLTASATDTTAGRVMRTGDGGLLGNAVALPSSDFNDAPAGFVGVSGSSGLNRPEVSGGGGATAAHWQFSDAFALQIGGALNPANGLAWRAKVSGAWGGWRLFFDRSNILGTVGQSAGVPTGAVIQRGSNGNGEFVRFADGTQICTHSVAVSLAIGTAHLGGFRSVGQGWTFPAAFAVAPAVEVLARNLTAFGAISANTPGTGAMQWAVTAVTSQAAASREVALTAIGRWF